MRFLSVLFVLTGGLLAQQNIKWIENNSPTGSRNAFPWGANTIRYQTIFDAAVLNNTPGIVNDIIVPGDINDTAPREVVYDDIEVRMGNTAVMHSALNTDWALNNPNPTTVYRGPLRVVYEPNAWRGFGLPRPWLYIPMPSAPNVCVEVICWQVRGYNGPNNFFFPAASGTVYRAYLLGWTSNQTAFATIGTSGSKFGLLFNGGNHVVLGAGCNSSANTPLTIGGPSTVWPTRGQTFPISLSGGRPSFPAVLTFGGSDQMMGPIQLPLALAPFGGGSCQLWTDPALSVVVATNATGNATLPVGIPMDPALSHARLFTSWVQLDPQANALGAATSGYMKLILD